VDEVTGSICKLSENKTKGETRAPTEVGTAPVVTFVPRFAPVIPKTDTPVVTKSPIMVPTFPPAEDGVPCKTAGHLHMDFGGDISSFGYAQENELSAKLQKALKLADGDLEVSRVTDADNTGSGAIVHPTKVQLNFKFHGADSIELGHQLEQDVAAGTFVPLPDFPLLRLEMEEIYCTQAPTRFPTFAPTPFPSATPTFSPTPSPTATPPPKKTETSSHAHAHLASHLCACHS
jgi:hypothetical protein